MKHSAEPLLRQRIMQIAAEHEDANDCIAQRNDGIFKVCTGQDIPRMLSAKFMIHAVLTLFWINLHGVFLFAGNRIKTFLQKR